MTPAETAALPAIALLRALDLTGWHNLVAIPPDGNIEGHTFPPGSWSAMAGWVDRRNGHANLYYSVNEPRPGTPDKKLLKADVGRIRAEFVDLDPAKGEPFSNERTRLAGIVESLRDDVAAAPSIVVDSGGGYQALWLLDKPLDAAEHAMWAEAQNRGLAAAIGADPSIFNIDRVLRLPGTINLPDRLKRKRGRQEASTLLIEVNGARYRADELAAIGEPIAAPPSAQEAETGGIDMAAVRALGTVDDLRSDLRERLSTVLAADPQLRSLWKGDPEGLIGPDDSGSGYLASLAFRLTAARAAVFDQQDFAELAWVWERSTVHDKPQPAREIARAWAKFRRVGGIEEFEGEYSTELVDKPDPPKRGLYRLKFSEAADRATIETADPLIEGLIDQETAIVVYGASNVGKTFVTLDLAFHIATGRPWQGRATAAGVVVYVAAEGGRGILKRLAALRTHYGVGDAPLDVVPCPINLLTSQADINALLALIGESAADHELPVRMVVIDTLSRALAGGDENASTDMGAFIKNVDRIRAAVKATLCIVHHSGKDAAKGARGWSGLRAAIDTEIEVVDGQIVVEKQRDLEAIKPLPFKLRQVDVGEDAKGRRVASCVIEVVVDDFGDAPMVAHPDDVAALTAIEDCQELDPAGVSFTDWLTAFAETSGRGAGNVSGGTTIGTTTRTAFKNAVNRLRRNGQVRRTKDRKWLTSALE